MEKQTLSEIKNELKNRLSEKRYRHSLAVADQAVTLAKRFDGDTKKSYFAGLIHDVCKDISREKLLQMAREFDIMLTKSELLCPKLWHAVVGAAYTERFFTDDADIIHAVRYHTTARKNMSLLEKIIYVADCISEDRTYPNVSKLRELSEQSLDSVIYEMTRITILELTEAGMPLHEDTTGAYNQLCFEKSEDNYGTRDDGV